MPPLGSHKPRQPRYPAAAVPVYLHAPRWLAKDRLLAVDSSASGLLVRLNSETPPKLHSSNMVELRSSDRHWQFAMRVMRVERDPAGIGHYVGLAFVQPNISNAHADYVQYLSTPRPEKPGVIVPPPRDKGLIVEVLKVVSATIALVTAITASWPAISKATETLRRTTPGPLRIGPAIQFPVFVGAIVLLIGYALKLVREVMNEKTPMWRAVVEFGFVAAIMLLLGYSLDFVIALVP